MFEKPYLSQIYAQILLNLVQGEIIQAKYRQKSAEVRFSSEAFFPEYISKTYFKTASMISLGCRGVGLIYDLDLEDQRRLFEFGAELGVSF